MTTASSHRPPFRVDKRGPLPTLIVGSTDGDHYDPAGSYDNARRLVWLHGLGWSPPASLALMSLVANAFGVTIYAPWLPNHGSAPNLTSYQEYSQCLCTWAEYFGLRGARWVGHSIGGYTVTELAISHPELVSGVVALAAPILAPYDRRPVPLLRAKVAALHLEAAGIITYALIAEHLNGYGRQLRTALVELGRPHVRYGNAIRVMEASPALDRSRLEALGDQLDGRFVTVYGGADAIVRPPRRSLRGCTSLVIPWVGHSFVALPGQHTARTVIQAISLTRGLTDSAPDQLLPGISPGHSASNLPATPAA